MQIAEGAVAYEILLMGGSIGQELRERGSKWGKGQIRITNFQCQTSADDDSEKCFFRAALQINRLTWTRT